jgi:UDP-N-acetyl-D-mannosaminuronic acid transferase (WecB/TagA/CpsF family)
VDRVPLTCLLEYIEAADFKGYDPYDARNSPIISGLPRHRGTLDTIVGTVKRAPPLFCRFGLEWFYRLITNPKRIRRQIVLPVFAWKVLKGKVILNKK